MLNNTKIKILNKILNKLNKEKSDKKQIYLSPEIEINNLGVEYIKKKRFASALNCFEKCLELSEFYPEALHNKAVVLEKFGKNKEALEFFDKALYAKKVRIIYLFYYKRYYLKDLDDENIKNAIKKYESLIKINIKQYVIFFLSKAKLLSKLNKKEESIELYKKALEFDPDNKIAREYLKIMKTK